MKRFEYITNSIDDRAAYIGAEIMSTNGDCSIVVDENAVRVKAKTTLEDNTNGSENDDITLEDFRKKVVEELGSRPTATEVTNQINQATLGGNGDPVDLSIYATKSELQSVAEDVHDLALYKQNIIDGDHKLNANYLSGLDNIAYTGSFVDLSDTEDVVRTIIVNGESKTATNGTVDLGTFGTGTGTGNYTKPANGIPASDMTASVQASLAKADTAWQPTDALPINSVGSGQINDGVVALIHLDQDVIDVLNSKVDKVSGKGLSTNDFTNVYKNKLDGTGDSALITKSEMTAAISNAQLSGGNIEDSLGSLAFVDGIDYSQLTGNLERDLNSALGQNGTIDAMLTDVDALKSTVNATGNNALVKKSQLSDYVTSTVAGNTYATKTDVENIGDNIDLLQENKLNKSAVTSTYSSTGTDPVNGKAIAAAIGGLDVANVGGSGKYIQAISETDGKISATVANFPTIFSGNYNDLTNKPTLTSGTVTSVAMTVPTGLSVSGSPITTSGTLALSFANGYSIPTTAKLSNWDTAYSWGNHAAAGYKTTDTNQTLQAGEVTFGASDVIKLTSSEESISIGASAASKTINLGLNVANANHYGGIKLGYTQTGKNYPVLVTSGGQAYVTVPWTDNNTTYNAATTSAAGLMSAADKSKLDGIAAGATANTGTLTAVKVNNTTASVSGTTADIGTVVRGIKLNGSSLTGNSAGVVDLGTLMTSDANTTYTFANGTNGFTVTPSGGSAQTVTVTPSITKAMVTTALGYTPPTTDTNTTYTAGTGISITGTNNTINCTITTANSGNPGTISKINFNGTDYAGSYGVFTIPKPTYTASEIGLGNVGNYKAVSTASQSLTNAEKSQARSNIGAGTSSFSGSYTDLTNTPTIPTKVSQLTNDSGFTTNAGTITAVKMNNATVASSGIADLGNVVKTIKLNGSNLTGTSAGLVDLGNLATTSQIPAAVTESTVSGWGFTKNSGTITGVKVNGGTTLSPTNGVVNIPGTLIAEALGGTGNSGLAAVAWSGDYNDLENKPTTNDIEVFTGAGTLQNGTSGLVPAPAARGTNGDIKYLTNTGSWEFFATNWGYQISATAGIRTPEDHDMYYDGSLECLCIGVSGSNGQNGKWIAPDGFTARRQVGSAWQNPCYRKGSLQYMPRFKDLDVNTDQGFPYFLTDINKQLYAVIDVVSVKATSAGSYYTTDCYRYRWVDSEGRTWAYSAHTSKPSNSSDNNTYAIDSKLYLYKNGGNGSSSWSVTYSYDNGQTSDSTSCANGLFTTNDIGRIFAGTNIGYYTLTKIAVSDTVSTTISTTAGTNASVYNRTYTYTFTFTSTDPSNQSANGTTTTKSVTVTDMYRG